MKIIMCHFLTLLKYINLNKMTLFILKYLNSFIFAIPNLQWTFKMLALFIELKNVFANLYMNIIK